MPKRSFILTYDDAKKLMKAATDSANKNSVPGAIAIVDSGGNLILLERLDNTMNSAANIAIGKAATAVSFKRPTIELENTVQKGRNTMLVLDSATAHPYIPLKGGYPIWYENELIGAIAVAGTMNAEMDEVLVLEALANKGW
jgi:glc operon protein GlcG